MITGWLYIIMCAASSLLIAHFLKIVETRGLNTVRVLTVNYLVASVIAFSTSGGSALARMDAGESMLAIGIAAVVGVIFIANFFIYSKSVYYNGVGISVAAMRLSLIIPVLLSILWYFEIVSILQWVGILLVFVTLFLLLPNKRKMLREPFSKAWLLVLLFIGTGLGDGSLKIYEEEFSSLLNKEQFMGVVFLTAFGIGLMVTAIRKNWKYTKMEWVMGIAVGIPNLYTAIFLIEALERMNGAIVYSSVNVLTVLGGTLLGIIKWGDTLTKIQWSGIVLTVITILLLI